MTLRAFQCFAAGTYTDMSGRTMSFTKAQVGEIAGNYSPSRARAPLVLGHPADNPPPPSYGTVEGLVAHDGALFCIGDVTPTLQRLVNDGRYKHVSASFLLPGQPGNPSGGYYLRHVGFLGAALPAVRGMQPLAFAVSFGSSVDAHAVAVDSVNFAAYGVPEESPRAQLYRAAKDLHRAMPDISFITAAARAERALAR